jgi:hypothetical protein
VFCFERAAQWCERHQPAGRKWIWPNLRKARPRLEGEALGIIGANLRIICPQLADAVWLRTFSQKIYLFRYCYDLECMFYFRRWCKNWIIAVQGAFPRRARIHHMTSIWQRN